MAEKMENYVEAPFLGAALNGWRKFCTTSDHKLLPGPKVYRVVPSFFHPKYHSAHNFCIARN